MPAGPFQFLHPALVALGVVPARGPSRAPQKEASARRSCARPSPAGRAGAVRPGGAEADRTVFRHYL